MSITVTKPQKIKKLQQYGKQLSEEDINGKRIVLLPVEANVYHQHLKDGMTLNIDGMVVSTML